jgi:hypothetical protein
MPVRQTVTNQLPWPLVSVYLLILPLYDRHQSTTLTTCVSLCADTSSVWPSPINYPDHLCQSMCWYFFCMTVTNQLPWPLVSVYVLILPLYDGHQSTTLTTCVSLCADTSSVWLILIFYFKYFCNAIQFLTFFV